MGPGLANFSRKVAKIVRETSTLCLKPLSLSLSLELDLVKPSFGSWGLQG